MKIHGEIQGMSLQKKGLKVTLFIDNEEAEEASKYLSNFAFKPIDFEILIDSAKQLESMNLITEDQRKKVYALFKRIGKEMGDTPENVKALIKQMFSVDRGIDISLSTMTMEEAGDLIEYIIVLADEQGWDIGEKPQKEEVNYLQQLYLNQKCFVCGEMGLQFSGKEGKICLCKKHALELKETKSEFMKKYKLQFI